MPILWSCIFWCFKELKPLEMVMSTCGFMDKTPPSDLFSAPFAAMPSFSIVIEPESNFISSDKFENFKITVKARWGNVAWNSEYIGSLLFFFLPEKWFSWVQNFPLCFPQEALSSESFLLRKRSKWPFLKFFQSDCFSTEVFKIHRHLFSISCPGNYSTITTNALLQPWK